MALIMEALEEIMRKPTIVGVLSELMMFCGPLWLAVLVGLLAGWAWRPRWATLLVGGAGEKGAAGGAELASEGVGLAMGFPSLESFKAQLPSCISSFMPEQKGCEEEKSEKVAGSKKLAVTTGDLQNLYQLVEETDGGPAWLQMMERSLPTMSYQAWRRDPEVGPPQYRSRTIFEDATPELVRAFFWDDEYRAKLKWDDMLIYHETLEECPTTGTMVVHWVRKFPFFCSDREYTIGRRIWESNRSFYCVTKGVPCPLVPRRNKPRRVDLYYSSWCIRPAESRIDGQMTACEVLLFHHEDMGIPWEIAKLGVRQGMWGAVKKIEPGLRAYQKLRESGAALTRCAYMAHINTKVCAEYLRQLESSNISNNDDELPEIENVEEKPVGKSLTKYLLFGGAAALACTLDRGLLTKVVIFGVARRFVKPGR